MGNICIRCYKKEKNKGRTQNIKDSENEEKNIKYSLKNTEGIQRPTLAIPSENSHSIT
jgi:hypothetical protein